MSHKTYRITFLVVLFLVAAGVAVGQTVHWRIKLNTNQIGQIIAGPNDTDPVLLSAVQSTQRIGVGTNSPWARLQIAAPAGDVFGIDDTTTGTGFDIYLSNGAGLGTYSNHPLYFMTNYNYRTMLSADGRFGFGVDPTAASYNANAKVVVCPPSVAFGSTCYFPTNLPTVLILGSSNNSSDPATRQNGSSIRAAGRIETDSDVYVMTGGGSRGIILKESNGTNCRRITVNNAGTITASAGFACP